RRSENDDVWDASEMFHGPARARAIQLPLDLVVNEQDFVFVQELFQPDEIFLRRDDVTARPLNGLDVKGAVLGRLRFRVPDAVIFARKEPFELVLAVNLATLALQPVNAAEAVGIENELGALAKVPVAPPVAVRGSDRGGPKSPPVVAAHEGEHQILAGEVPDDFERILDGLRPTHVEVDPPFHP